jgi:NitT/TauT family transport system permease protein
MRVGKWLKPVLLFVALLVLWQAAVVLFNIPTFLLPSPLQVAVRMSEIPNQLLDNTLVTLYEVLAGFALAVVVGVVLATLIVHSRFLAESLYPLLIITQVTPQVAIAPLLVIWFGYGDLPKIIIAFFVAFFPMVVNTATGLLRVPEELLDLMRGLRTPRWRIFLMIRFPNALPYIFAGMRISITLAVIGAVVGEFVAANEGLGYLVFNGTANNDTALTFAAIFILATIGITLFWIVDGLRRVVVPWARDPDEGEA